MLRQKIRIRFKCDFKRKKIEIVERLREQDEERTGKAEVLRCGHRLPTTSSSSTTTTTTTIP